MACAWPARVYLSIYLDKSHHCGLGRLLGLQHISIYLYTCGEQGMAADSASSTETSGLGLLRPTEAEASVLEAE